MKRRSFLFILIFLSFNFLQAQDFKQIQNRWKTNQYLHNESRSIEVGPLGLPGWHSAHWQFIPVAGTKYVQIKNRFGSKFYLHNENGKIEVGPLGKPDWWSAQWEIVKVSGTDFIRIKNRWKPTQYLHNEYGKIEVGPLGKPGWWSAQWLVKKPASTPNPTPVVPTLAGVDSFNKEYSVSPTQMYQFVAKDNNRYVAVHNDQIFSGTAVSVGNYDFQRTLRGKSFRVVPTADNKAVNIQSTMDYNMLLTVDNSQSSNHAFISPKSGQSNQKFHLIEVPGGRYFLFRLEQKSPSGKNLYLGLSDDLKGLVIRDKTGHESLYFKLERKTYPLPNNGSPQLDINTDEYYTIESIGKAGKSSFFEGNGQQILLREGKKTNAKSGQKFQFIPAEGNSFKIRNENEQFLTYNKSTKKISLEPKGAYGKQIFGITTGINGHVIITTTFGIGLPIYLTVKDNTLSFTSNFKGFSNVFQLTRTNVSTVIPVPTKDLVINKKFYYFIESKERPGQVIHIDSELPIPGTPLRLSDNQSQPWQRFAFIPDGKGYYYIESNMQPDIVIVGRENEQNIELNEKRIGVPLYRFKIKDAGNGYVAFESATAPFVYLGLAAPNANVKNIGFNKRYSLVLRSGFDPDMVLFKLTQTIKSVIKPATVGFFNEGGYIAKYSLSYDIFGETKSFSTGRMAFKEARKEYNIPRAAHNVRVKGEAFQLFDWKTIFSLRYKDPKNVCFKTYDDFITPEYNENCKPWVPIIDGNVHIYNETGETIYASYCTDLVWSLANMTGGLVTGLLLENTQKPDPNYVRLLAFCLATDISLPDGFYNLFKEVAFEVNNNKSRLIVNTNVLETLKSLFDFVDSPEESVLQVALDNMERSDDFKTKNLEYNPIIAGAGIFGAKTLNLVIFNKDFTKYWLIPTGIDDSWIIRKDNAVGAKKGTLTQEDTFSNKYPSVAVPK